MPADGRGPFLVCGLGALLRIRVAGAADVGGDDGGVVATAVVAAGGARGGRGEVGDARAGGGGGGAVVGGAHGLGVGDAVRDGVRVAGEGARAFAGDHVGGARGAGEHRQQGDAQGEQRRCGRRLDAALCSYARPDAEHSTIYSRPRPRTLRTRFIRPSTRPPT